MGSIFNASRCDQKMGASHLLGSLYNLVPVLQVMLCASELLVSQIGCDIKERASFGELFAKLLHDDVM